MSGISRQIDSLLNGSVDVFEFKDGLTNVCTWLPVKLSRTEKVPATLKAMPIA
ncbi:MAG TPA: hypothetical protein VNA15_05255 [Candidatus Angelobacter sp.]|nr:hypothetical protein [Candidatus Angelobacter sp.]